MEYDWSHVVCNQEKSVVNFLQIVDNKVSTRDDEIKKVLSDIWNSKRAYGGLFKTMLHQAFKTEKEFVETRLVAVKKRLEVIVNYLQSRLSEAPKLMMLLAMGQALGRTHPVIDKILLDDITEKVEAGVGMEEEEEGVENLHKLQFMEWTPTSPSEYPPSDTRSPEQMRVADSLARASYPPGPPQPVHRGGVTRPQGYPRSPFRTAASGRT